MQKIMKNAMGLWQAIMIILLVSGMMLIVLKYASISAKHTRNSFVREQAELFLNSAVEQTLLKISCQDRKNDGCLVSYSPTDLEKRGVVYSADINITKYYLQTDSDDATYCKNTNGTTVVDIGDGSAESHGLVLLEVEVIAKVKDGTKIISRILRRTLQQP